MSEREAVLRRWVEERLGHRNIDLRPASEDASFRRYFRARIDGDSYIVMDAPPDKEDVGPYVAIAASFLELGLNVPEVLAREEKLGLLLLTDLGSELYLNALNDTTVKRLYGDALGALIVLQTCGPVGDQLPPYDGTLLRSEMALFTDWLVGRHLGLVLDGETERALEACLALVVSSALEQPRCCVHRDYHSRNLMVTAKNNPGILDFQDAVVGPVTYDLVSLLRDCYIAWPRGQVEGWVRDYHDLALQSGVIRDIDEMQFLRWFDWMGVQRHLKAAGIFARLYHRDGKAGFLKDIPRTLEYVRQVAADYPELAALQALVETRVLPALSGAAGNG